MTSGAQLYWGWLRDRLRLAWPFAVALCLLGMSVQRLVPVVRENSARARGVGRLNREMELLQQNQQSATDDDVEARMAQALSSLISGDEGVRQWVQAIEQAAARCGFACESQIESGARAWEGEPRVDVIEVALGLNAKAGFGSDATPSARLTKFLDSLAARSEWVAFTALSLRGTGAGLTSAMIKVRLWVFVPIS